MGEEADVADRRQTSTSTRRGDGGDTSLPNGARVSKGELRVETAGSIDELNSAIGLARALCDDLAIAARIRAIQRELFPLGSSFSTLSGGRRAVPEISDDMVAQLDAFVDELEAEPGLIRDWTLPGDLRHAAAFDVARTICRRAERNAVRLMSSGVSVQKNALAYLNRLSDVLWLVARVLETRAGVDSRLRDAAHPGPPWSRAW
jgi:cob(I)alamin adenosyltransferase